MAVLLSLLASALWGTADFLGGTVSRRLPVLVVVGLSQAVALVALLPLVLLTGGLDEPRGYLVPGLLAGIAGLVGLACFYRALAVGTMGVVAPVAALGVVVPVLAGLATGEDPGAVQLAGIALAVVAVVLASGPELSGDGRGGLKPLLLALAAALGFGVVFVLLAEGSDGGGLGAVVMTLLVMRMTSVLVVGALVLAQRPDGARPGRADLLPLVVVGLFDVGANGTFAVASQSDLVSVTAVLSSLYPVVTVLLARRFHAERLNRVQLAGVTGALAAVVLLAAG